VRQCVFVSLVRRIEGATIAYNTGFVSLILYKVGVLMCSLGGKISPSRSPRKVRRMYRVKGAMTITDGSDSVGMGDDITIVIVYGFEFELESIWACYLLAERV
jgi:hypothetical protein